MTYMVFPFKNELWNSFYRPCEDDDWDGEELGKLYYEVVLELMEDRGYDKGPDGSEGFYSPAPWAKSFEFEASSRENYHITYACT